MDTTEAINQTTIYDLPIEVIAIILKYVVSYEDRKSSRSVCVLWRDLINRDSTSEKYSMSKKNMINSHGYKFPKFSHLVSEFLSYQRKKTSLEFKCVDLDETDDYWIEKGKHIIGLNFEICINIPIEEICKHCDNIKEIKIMDIGESYKEFERNVPIKQTAEKGIINSSVQLLSIFFLWLNEEQMFDFVQQCNVVFPCLKKLNLLAADLCKFDDLDTISQKFANYKFKIHLTIFYSLGGGFNGLEVEFNSLPDRPVSLLHVITIARYQSEEEFLNSIHKYYYKDLRYLAVDFYTDISLLKFQELISNSSLKVIGFYGTHIFHIVEFFKNHPQESVLRYLEPWLITSITIEKNMVNSYPNINSLRIDSIPFKAFSQVINGLTTLANFYCEYAIPESDMIELSHKDVVKNESLLDLQIPVSFFLQTSITEWIYLYIFPNLKKLSLSNDLANRNIDHEDLKHMYCPKLTDLHIHLFEPFDYNKPEVHIEWIKNILFIFPNIECLMLNGHSVDPSTSVIGTNYLPISDEELSDIIRTCPKLQYVNCFLDGYRRIEELQSRM